MSYLGIDLGTIGCKATIFTEKGAALSTSYREYQIVSEQRGWAELDSEQVWKLVKNMISDCVSRTSVEIEAVSVSSLGEAMVPVSNDRRILGNSLLNYDSRGSRYIEEFKGLISDDELYNINGNAAGPNYSLTRYLWYLHEQPELYEKTDKFLHWSGFVLFMLGAEAITDYSLANRTLLLDIEQKRWNYPLINKLGLSAEKFPRLAEAGSRCGRMDASLAEELGLKNRPLLVVGSHDQCANAVGCGIITKDTAMYGMGTFHCIVSVFNSRPHTAQMLQRGLNTEHHAVPGSWVSFIYNQGGILLKWFRDTYAVEAVKNGESNIYQKLLEEMPEGPSPVSVLPHLTTTGTPDFIEKTSGLISGLTIDTSRGDICKGVLEGIAFYLRESLDNLPEGMGINKFTAVGGGSKSDIWMQLTADILQRPCYRTVEAEAGSLGAAILASCGADRYSSIEEAVSEMVSFSETFEPTAASGTYDANYERYKRVFPLFGDFLAEYKN